MLLHHDGNDEIVPSPQRCQLPLTSHEEPILDLPISQQKSRNLRSLGLALVTIDLTLIPLTYYYGLKFGTVLTQQQGMKQV